MGSHATACVQSVERHKILRAIASALFPSSSLNLTPLPHATPDLGCTTFYLPDTSYDERASGYHPLAIVNSRING